VAFLAELWLFMPVRKKFWVTAHPHHDVAFGGLVRLTKSSVIAPFVYTMF
jgi:hypothetical protein